MNLSAHHNSIALSVAGFDPSGGAGVLADAKTMEHLGVLGQAVITGNTLQNDLSFQSVSWCDALSLEQIKVLLERHSFAFVKIGLVSGLSYMKDLLALLLEANKDVVIVWDPILKASAGFDFHERWQEQELQTILQSISLLTPNASEALVLGSSDSAEINAKALSAYCPVLLKGGHSEGDVCSDVLFQQGEESFFSSPRIAGAEKHGSGCVLSSAILSYLALGHSLESACEQGFIYMQTFLTSSNSLLGVHTHEVVGG